MSTYDETVGAAVINWNSKAPGDLFRLQHALVVTEAVARHATPTTNTYFATADVLQLMDFPAGCIFLFSVFRTVSPGTASGTCDLGENGDAKFDSGVACDAAAGTVVVDTVVSGIEDDFFSAANTADLEVLTSNMDTADTGSYVWSLLGATGL